MPSRARWAAVPSAWVVLIWFVTPLAAQATKKAATPNSPDATPSIKSLLPKGATVGKSTEWKITGTNLAKVERWVVTGTGVEVGETKPDGGNNIKVVAKVADDADPGFRELRGVGPEGFSNVVLFRVDPLPQSEESEPNDDPAKANPISLGTAVAGVLKPQDVDHFRVEAKAGQRITLEVEAQRLGTPISPVVTVLTAGGAALAQGRENPGADRDCRLSFDVPADGSYLVQVRDNAFAGADSAGYRLRVDMAPFATGLFPLGGPRGQSITVTASGGDLDAPRSKTVMLPDTPGATVEVGPFDGPGGPVLAPGRLLVGDGPEINESPPGPDGTSKTTLPIGTTANGRLDRPGEVDRYTVTVKKGEAIHVRIQAAPLGSWIDSVVTLRDDKGAMLAENDDPNINGQRRNVPQPFGGVESPPDSRLDYAAKADGELTLEVADRYGAGGPEYAYRLDVGSAKPDFSISLLMLNPNPNRGLPVNVRAAPGMSGAFNIKPGGRVPVNFLVTPEGFSGSIEVKAEGLPAGVTAAPVPIRIAGGGRNTQPVGGFVELKADPAAEPAIGELRIVAVGKPAKGDEITRTATATIGFPALANANNSPFGIRTLTRVLTKVPVAVTDGPRTIRKDVVGPPEPVALTLKDIPAPPPLLQGGRLELALSFDPPNPARDRFVLEAELKGRGLVTQTMNSGEQVSTSEGEEAGSIVRVMAAVDAEVGRKTLAIRFEPKGGKEVVKEVPIDVRTPIQVTVPAEPVRLAPGGSTTVKVGVMREAGYGSPIDLQFEDLPKGVKAVGSLRVARDKTELDVQLEMDAAAGPIVEPVAFRVAGVARMPRGPVRVDSAKRPMIVSVPAEK